MKTCLTTSEYEFFLIDIGPIYVYILKIFGWQCIKIHVIKINATSSYYSDETAINHTIANLLAHRLSQKTRLPFIDSGLGPFTQSIMAQSAHIYFPLMSVSGGSKAANSAHIIEPKDFPVPPF